METQECLELVWLSIVRLICAIKNFGKCFRQIYGWLWESCDRRPTLIVFLLLMSFETKTVAAQKHKHLTLVAGQETRFLLRATSWESGVWAPGSWTRHAPLRRGARRQGTPGRLPRENPARPGEGMPRPPGVAARASGWRNPGRPVLPGRRCCPPGNWRT